jgi:hypothetical protein
MHATLTFGDGLKDAGLCGETRICLSREDGHQFLKMVTQCKSPFIEDIAHDKFKIANDCIFLSFAGLTFSWPVVIANDGDRCSSQMSKIIDIVPRLHHLR